ncbi:MAG TPA: glycosyltransferase, partial [Solirubrobacteraceae bacterium]|nr:glycosyltransferase [Solirubrobacteraceae bacterium]
MAGIARLRRQASSIAAALREIAAAQRSMPGQIDRLRAELARPDDAIGSQLDGPRAARATEDERYAGLEGRLRAVQALLARIYERQADWTTQVEQLRREPGYDDAWDGEPLVSVRIATYNRASLLVDRALASVRRQTYANWEAIVVGDACTDDTAERVDALGDRRIRFENLPVRGPYPADETANWQATAVVPMNRASELARGAWIAPLDDDDEWDDDHIEALLAHARLTRAEVVHGRWRMIDAQTGRRVNHQFGENHRPSDGRLAWQAAILHAKLTRFPYDANCHLADEVSDVNLARRLWDAGVRFAYLDRPVVTHWDAPRTAIGRAWRDEVIRQHGFAEDPPTGDEPPPLSHNTVPSVEHFAHPALAPLLREIWQPVANLDYGWTPAHPDRKSWEVAMAVRALRDHDVLRPDADVLGVGAGIEATVFVLTRHVGRVFATDLYLTPGDWGHTATTGMLTDPQRFWAGGFDRRRLVVQHMDALDLQHPDGAFDGVFSSSSIEHFGDLDDVSRAMDEIHRVLRPGGVVSLSTEFRLDGPPPGLPG